MSLVRVDGEERMDEMEEFCKRYEERKCNEHQSFDAIDLKNYIDTRLADVQIAADSRFTDLQKVVDVRTSVVQIALDKAEAGMNEFHEHIITRGEF